MIVRKFNTISGSGLITRFQGPYATGELLGDGFLISDGLIINKGCPLRNTTAYERKFALDQQRFCCRWCNGFK